VFMSARAFGSLALVPLVSLSLSAQPTQGPAFEVASVKENKMGFGAGGKVAIGPGDRVTIINLPLRALIQEAYGLTEQRLVGGPGWIANSGFDILAKAETTTTAAQLRLMMRRLLAERFRLVVHTETRETSTYALVLNRRDGKLGANLRAAATDCAALRAAAQPGENDPCGIRTLASALMTGTMTVRGLSLDNLTGLITREAGRLIVNKTGLSGAFDWELRWTPQVFLQRSFDSDRFPSIDPDGPSLFAALQEQLGLKLDPDKDSVEVLVIDSVERPTPD
jgi:uncharacterized protein (TIGR03435 family)